MKRLVIMTVGKTHSGKTTFAKALEKELENSFIMDQDNHALFINRHYKKLQPQTGPNMLKHAISQLIVEYAIKNTNLHLIVSNSNRSRQGRLNLLNELFNEEQFVRILVHFDIPYETLQERVKQSTRSTDIFRVARNFEEVLMRQEKDSQAEDIADPEEGEADYLFIIRDNAEIREVILEIVSIAKDL